MNNPILYGNYRSRRFTEIFPSANDFVGQVNQSELAILSDSDLRIIYYLLYARHGNDPIANSDENQFKYKLYSLLFTHGPTWSKRIEIQEKLRGLNEEDLLTGGKAIYNHAYNPSTAPSTATLEELTAIDSQNTTNYRKSKLEGYSLLLSLLETDVTTEFIRKFDKLFLQVVQPDYPLYYEMEEQTWNQQ